MSHPEAADLLALLEGCFGGERREAELVEHLKGCTPCRTRLEALRREAQDLDLSIAELWEREGLSCPHPDVLQAWLAGGLDEGQRVYVAFHLKDLECARCAAVVEDLSSPPPPPEDPVSQAEERALHSTTIFLRSARR